MQGSRESIQHSIDDLPVHRRAWLTWKLYRDPRVSPGLKRAITVGAFAYVVSPIDVLPDLLLGVGQIDDVGVLVGLVFLLSNLLVKFAPSDVLASYLDGTSGSVRPEDAGPRRKTDSEGDIDVPFQVR